MADSLKRTSSAKGMYLWAAKDFLSWNGDGEITEDRVLDYLDHREREGDQHHTLKARYYALRYLMNNVLDIHWKPKETSVFATRERRRKPEPAMFSREEVEQIIEAVKAKGDTQQKAIFAVSTVYGCRRSELCDIRREDLDIKGRTITIYTRKGGREAKQPIPEEVEPYLKAYSWEPVGASTLNSLFQRTMRLAFGQERLGMGFHAIRHCLVTELNKTELSAEEIYNFMRWGEPGIMAVYVHRKPGEVESRVFEQHPFIPLWR